MSDFAAQRGSWRAKRKPQRRASVQGEPKSTVKVTTNRLIIAMVGKYYDTSLEATGGTGPYRWTIVGDPLPSGLGLHLDGTGRIVGRPKNHGTFPFTVQVTDAHDNESGKQHLILTVSPKLRITSDVSPPEDLTAPGKNFIARLHVEGGSPPYKWELEPESGLEGKIELDDTGTITWPDRAVYLRTKRFTVKCTDQDGLGYFDTATFFIKARPPWRPWRRRGSTLTLERAGLSVTVRPSWGGLLFHTSNYLILLGVGLPSLGAVLILFYAVATPGSTLGYLGVGLLTAFAAFLIGGLGGFLFGIPKMVSSGQARHAGGPQYAPSSNLAEVSDWLTKLLLGAGLVQLTHLGAPVASLIDHIAHGLYVPPASAGIAQVSAYTAAARVMAGAIFFGYTAVGLLDGYVMTTTWYQSWIVRHAGQS